MNLTKYNKFRSVLGFLLVWSMFIALPVFANQDSVSTTVEVSDVSSVEEAVATDTTATAEVVAVDSSDVAVSATATTSGDVKKEEVKKTDPQVYKNIFYYVMFFLLICIVVAVIGKVHHIYTLSRKLNGKYNPLGNNNLQAALLLVFLAFFLWGVYYSFSVWGAWSWRDAVTEHGKDIDLMFMVTTVITTFVMIVVHILLLVFSYVYRMRKDKKAYYYPHNDFIERIWTIVPAIVLTVLVLFGFFTWRKITNVPEELQKSALQIEVLGEQFQWTVRYPGADGQMGKRNYKLTTPKNSYGIDFTDKTSWDDIKGDDIVIPVNQSVRFHIISKDIIHSFYIPDFRVQINAVPGMTNYFQFTPTLTTREMRDKMNDQAYDYWMLCAKICGEAHYNMKKKVVVVTDAEYKEWLGKQAKFFTEDLQKEFANANGEADLNLASLN